MYANKPSVLGLLDKLRVERGSHDSHIYMVEGTTQQADFETDRHGVSNPDFPKSVKSILFETNERQKILLFQRNILM